MAREDAQDPGAWHRLAWVCALLTEVYRTGMIWPGSVLDTDDPIETADHLLALVPAEAVADLRALTDVAGSRLLPALRDLAARGPTHPSPTFSGSKLMPADADLVTGHALVELKTQLSRRREDGTRVLSLEAATLRQFSATSCTTTTTATALPPSRSTKLGTAS